MERIVTSCVDCPFYQWEVDEDDSRFLSEVSCALDKGLNIEEKELSQEGAKFPMQDEIPANCPLKKDSILVKV